MTTGAERASRAEKLAWAFASFPRFCGLLQIQPKSGGGRIPLVLSPIQRLFNSARTTRDIVLKPRQVHMTTLEAARDLWWFLTKPGARVVVVCQSQTDQAALKDIAYKIRLYVDSLRRLGVMLKFGTESSTEWTLPDRDATLRVIQAGASEASASKKGRGGTVNRLHITEAAFFERAEETFNSLMESVPKDGSEVVNESTPNGASGFYYEQWRASVDGRSAYKPHFFAWWLHPDYRQPLEPGEMFEPRAGTETALAARGVPVECLKWYRWKVADKGGNEELVAQEFPNDPETCFLVSGRAFFDSAITASLIASATDPARIVAIRGNGAVGELRIWHMPERGKSYVIGADTSEGVGGDASVGHVFERSTGRHMATLDGQLKPWEFARHLARVATGYNGASIAVERNNHGHAVLRCLESECHYARLFHDRDGRPGWLTTAVSRAPALDTLEQAHRAGHFKTSDRPTLSELRTFVVTDTGKAEAARGSHDDHVMAAAIAWDVLCRRDDARSLGGLESI